MLSVKDLSLPVFAEKLVMNISFDDLDYLEDEVFERYPRTEQLECM